MSRNLVLILCLFAFGSCVPKKQEEKKTDSYEIPQVEDYIEHYPTGIKKLEGKKVEGKRHGRWIFYYDNGMKWSEGTY
jgi:antitoxin component YwqK of YwqJK toxin-antitoxin module